LLIPIVLKRIGDFKVKKFWIKILMFFGFDYLLNTNTGEVHDLNNIKPKCGLDRMSHINKFYLTEKTYSLLKKSDDKDINGCRHCLPEDDTD
jgi:hypothetical protein